MSSAWNLSAIILAVAIIGCILDRGVMQTRIRSWVPRCCVIPCSARYCSSWWSTTSAASTRASSRSLASCCPRVLPSARFSFERSIGSGGRGVDDLDFIRGFENEAGTVSLVRFP